MSKKIEKINYMKEVLEISPSLNTTTQTKLGRTGLAHLQVVVLEAK